MTYLSFWQNLPLSSGCLIEGENEDEPLPMAQGKPYPHKADNELMTTGQ